MNTSTETCPSLEDLAAFLEGRLSGDERARIVAHLADCPDCYEVFAEAARFEILEEEEEEEEEEEVKVAAVAAVPREPLEDPPPGKVFPFPRRPAVRWISSIAAVLAVVAVGIPLYNAYYTIPDLNAQELVSTGLSEKAAQDEFWSQWTNRGQNDNVAIDNAPHEFLLGAHLVDLRLSLVLKDEQGIDDALARINGHLVEFGTRVEEQAKFYAAARVQLSQGQLPRDFPQQAERKEASLRSDEYPYLDFGKWAEAGRLSALAQSPDFFEAPENQKFLQAFLHHELKNLKTEAPEVAADLGEIQETLDRTGPSSLPYPGLQKRFEEILTFYQKESEEGLAPVIP
jgi:hypothetical protein